MMRSTILVLVALGLGGCATESLEPYYGDRVDPTVNELSATTEIGNVGGETLQIRGSGFGDSVDDVVVLLGHHNVEVLSVTDDTIEILTPPGPITGGPVDLMLATETGYVEVEDAYTYDMMTLHDGKDLYSDQTSYIVVHNMWTSCYGGLWDNTDAPGSCDDMAFYGESGITGKGEFLNFVYPRVHAADQFWVTGNDQSVGEWYFTDQFDYGYPSGIDDLRYRVGDSFTITNDAYADSNYEVDMACANRATDPSTCDNDDVKVYSKGVMEFCETQDPKTGGTYTYEADWPVRFNPFSVRNGGPDPFLPVDVTLDVPGLGDGLSQELTLPGAMHVYGKSGFQTPELWALSYLDACMDGDEDGSAWLDEDGMVFTWEPVADDVDLGAPGVEHSTYVVASISLMHFGWFGGEGFKLRGSVVVPDEYQVDDETGMSVLGIPNEILYQFPSPNFEWSGVSTLSQTGYLGTWESGASYIFIEIMRVTDFEIPLDDGGSLVFSYVTGDMGLPAWENPIEAGDTCSDCVDGDGDGWVDGLDPDCNTAVGGTEDEVNATSDFTCNDGIDNDGDGFIDSEDEKCDAGWDGETTCTDGIDNDEDGWVDDLDADCLLGDLEDGTGDGAACSDGLDNDGDGWFDADDPGCADGSGTDEGGYSGTLCNDGLDNDDHGDIDAMDPHCALYGAFEDAEQPVFASACADGLDNETGGDGFIDELDPDCEQGFATREFATEHDPAEYPLVTQCYDGIDNDMDGVIDAADDGCWNPLYSFLADGFLADESVKIGTTDCTNGLDDDNDGWFDGADPDCQPGLGTQDELGWGTTQCNDGLDNDGDGLIDADDPECTSAEKNTEEF